MAKNWQKFCLEVPDEYLCNVGLFTEITRPIDYYAFSSLSKDIWNKFEDKRQTRTEFLKKIELLQKLGECTKTAFPWHGFIVAGSTLNRFGLKDSDIDLSFLTMPIPLDKYKNLNILRKLKTTLMQDYKCMRQVEIIDAKVPLLKFEDTNFSLSLDINCTDINNVRNTYLMYWYSQVDWRVQPLAVVIKLWSKHDYFKNSQLSSYSLTLMLINFLQVGVNPRILPSLQDLLPDKFNATRNIQELDFCEKLNIPFKSENRQSLEELLIEFFKYYANFKYQSNVISVRSASVIPLNQYKSTNFNETFRYRYLYLCIEEPFRLVNVGSVIRFAHDFTYITRRFAETYSHLETKKNLSYYF